jgi:hypothetical protein
MSISPTLRLFSASDCEAPTDLRSLFEAEYVTSRKWLKLSRNTQKRMEHDLTRWERLSGNPALGDLCGDLFDAVRDRGQALELSDDTIETTIGSVFTILRFARKRGAISGLPDAGEKLSRTKKRKPIPSVEDLGNAYLSADVARWPEIRGVRVGDFWRAWLVAGYFTGLRLDDQMHILKWSQVTADSIACEAGKTGKFHVFPNPPVLSRHLDLLRDAGDERVFPVSKSPHLIRRELHRISQAAGLSVAVLPQALRRLAGTRWQKAKWGAGTTLLGHTLGVSDRYIAPEILQEAVRRLEVPEAFLSPDETKSLAAKRKLLTADFDRLDESAQQMVADLIERLSG